MIYGMWIKLHHILEYGIEMSMVSDFQIRAIK